MFIVYKQMSHKSRKASSMKKKIVFLLVIKTFQIKSTNNEYVFLIIRVGNDLKV